MGAENYQGRSQESPAQSVRLCAGLYLFDLVTAAFQTMLWVGETRFAAMGAFVLQRRHVQSACGTRGKEMVDPA